MANISLAMLCKIACVIAPALSIQFGLTPPNKPPPEKEQFIPDNKGSVQRTSEVVLRRILAPGGPSTYFKLLLWITAILESCHIMLQPAAFLDLPAVRTSPSKTEVACATLAVLGGFLRVHCFRALGQNFTFQISRQEDHKLITSGAYAYVRHPSYLAAFISFGGAMPLYFLWLRVVVRGMVGMAFVGVWYGAMALMLITLLGRLKSEDEFLEREFGDEWKEWSQKVPWRIVPFVY